MTTESRPLPLSEEDEKYLRDFGEWDGNRDTHKTVLRLLDLLHAERERAEKALLEKEEQIRNIMAEAIWVKKYDLDRLEKAEVNADELAQLKATLEQVRVQRGQAYQAVEIARTDREKAEADLQRARGLLQRALGAERYGVLVPNDGRLGDEIRAFLAPPAAPEGER